MSWIPTHPTSIFLGWKLIAVPTTELDSNLPLFSWIRNLTLDFVNPSCFSSCLFKMLWKRQIEKGSTLLAELDSSLLSPPSISLDWKLIAQSLMPTRREAQLYEAPCILNLCLKLSPLSFSIVDIEYKSVIMVQGSEFNRPNSTIAEFHSNLLLISVSNW